MNKICPICDLEMSPGEIVVDNLNIRGTSGIRNNQWMQEPSTTMFKLMKLMHLQCLRQRLGEFEEIPDVKVKSLLRFEDR